MDERCRFVVKCLEPGANISQLCREFGISRMVGYKWLNRYRHAGFEALRDQSRRPKNIPVQTAPEMVCEIVRHRLKKPDWGARKIQDFLFRDHPKDEVPCCRTIERVMKRCGLIAIARQRRRRSYPEGIVIQPESPNDVWTVDFKGWWLMKDRKRCEPLTIRDEYSRFLLEVSAMTKHNTDLIKDRFRICFEKYGMPRYMRSDNGSPFAAVTSLCGLTRLSVWWIRLGIVPNRIPLSSPQCNGGHERMHKDMYQKFELDPAINLYEQQKLIDVWKMEFNFERPHDALNMKKPAECYTPSPRSYDSREPEYVYPSSFRVYKVDDNGRIHWKTRQLPLTLALAHEHVGIESLGDGKIRVWYCDFCLGETDTDFRTRLTRSTVGSKESETDSAETQQQDAVSGASPPRLPRRRRKTGRQEQYVS